MAAPTPPVQALHLPPGLRRLTPSFPRYPVGLYGGTFNPPTLSHEWVAQQALQVVEHLIVVPSHHHPFKGRDMAIPFADRLALTRAALGHLPWGRVTVSGVEARLPPPAYTLNVARRLMDEHTCGVPPAIVIGADLLGELPRWHRAGELLRAFPFVILPDTGLHATRVRQLLDRGHSVRHLVNPLVWRYLTGQTVF